MIEYSKFKHIILHAKPHKRFLIVNTPEQNVIEEFYSRLNLELNFSNDINVLKINRDLKIENATSKILKVLAGGGFHRR